MPRDGSNSRCAHAVAERGGTACFLPGRVHVCQSTGRLNVQFVSPSPDTEISLLDCPAPITLNKPIPCMPARRSACMSSKRRTIAGASASRRSSSTRPEGQPRRADPSARFRYRRDGSAHTKGRPRRAALPKRLQSRRKAALHEPGLFELLDDPVVRTDDRATEHQAQGQRGHQIDQQRAHLYPDLGAI